MAQSLINPKIRETVTLHKFEGDGPPDRTDQPIETVVIEDGKIISHVIYKEEDAAH